MTDLITKKHDELVRTNSLFYTSGQLLYVLYKISCMLLSRESQVMNTMIDPTNVFYYYMPAKHENEQWFWSPHNAFILWKHSQKVNIQNHHQNTYLLCFSNVTLYNTKVFDRSCWGNTREADKKTSCLILAIFP